MSRFPYTIASRNGGCATLGLVVLQVDETIEQDFRRFVWRCRHSDPCLTRAQWCRTDTGYHRHYGGDPSRCRSAPPTTARF